jgi:hypothetical protein
MIVSHDHVKFLMFNSMRATKLPAEFRDQGKNPEQPARFHDKQMSQALFRQYA